jgi:uncharacterized protein (TIGR03663 family)
VSTIAEERPLSRPDEEGTVLDRVLTWRPRLTPEVLAYAAVVAAAFLLRFWDLGGRAMHHDESLHATFSWYLFEGRGYQHDPLMHGPFLFHAMALVYLLFGVGDATARFVPAAFGTGMVLLPLLLRPWLGRVGALAAAALLALSPTILYFSRFVGAGAQDIITGVAMLVMVAGIWHYLRSGAATWLYVTAGGLALSFTTKEVAYIQAAILVLYLNGLAAADLAAQVAEGQGWSAARRRAVAAALTPIAWALVLFWPSLARPRERWRLREVPRSGGLLIVVGTLAAPMFAAASQVLLEHLGVHMNAPSPLFGWTNEKLWGAITIGGLIALGAYFGTGWRPREWLIAAAVFWAIALPLYTTFFTNPDGIATGIWGSLDYWLEQQDVRRGTQPVFYYLILTPVYEYVTLLLALGGAVVVAARTGRDTFVAALFAVAVCVAGAVLGDGAHAMIPFAVAGVVAATYAMRGRPFSQFLVFWIGATLFGLSAAGEKMPWLEVHLALPLALLAAVTVNDAAAAVRGVPLPAWVRPVAALGALGLAVAALALASDRFVWANPLLLAVVLGAVAAAALLAVRRLPAAAPAAVAFLLGFLGPLSVRAGVVAALEHGDIPVEMLVYTQTTPELVRIKQQIDRYARESGLGYDLPITVDSTEAFTWPWAWYLRDYRRVSYPELGPYLRNPALLGSLPDGGVLLTEIANAQAGVAVAGKYGPGQRYKHRWWFPEEYRSTTTGKLFEWLFDGRYRKLWADYFLHRVPPAPLGSIDAVAYFPPGWTPGEAAGPRTQAAPEPVTDAEGRLYAGAPGASRGQLQQPAGLAVDGDGNVYVADSFNSRVQKFDRDGRFVAVLGGPDRFFQPWGVAVDRDGSVYVADTWNHRIQKYDRDGRFLRAWGRPAPQADLPNPDPLELYGPRAIAVDAAGNLLVVDTGNHRVIRFSPDGQPLGTFGRRGSGPGQFEEPVGIGIGPAGDIYVVDTWNGRVQRFDAAFAYQGEFAVDGWLDHNVLNKPYLAVAPDGTLYVTVPDRGTVLHLDADGRPLGTVATFAADAAGTPGRPLGVAVDGRGRLWVSDLAGGRLVRLMP